MIRAAIIGCGTIAGGFDATVPDPADPGAWTATHAGAYRLCADTQLVAVAEPDEAARTAFAKRWGVPAAYADFREMLAAERPRMVSLCLSTEHHAGAFAAALHAGAAALFMEKPLSNRLDEARAMAELAARSGAVVAVNHFRRWIPDYAEVGEKLAGGAWGRVLHAVFRYAKGVLVNGTHHIDTARQWFGEPQAVRLIRVAAPDPVDPGLDFMMEFAGGTTAHVLNVPGAPYVFFDIDILCETARIRLSQRGQRLSIEPVEREPHFGRFDIVAERPFVETGWRNSPLRAVQELVSSLGRGGGTPACTVADGLANAEIAHRLLAQANEEGSS